MFRTSCRVFYIVPKLTPCRSLHISHKAWQKNVTNITLLRRYLGSKRALLFPSINGSIRHASTNTENTSNEFSTTPVENALPEIPEAPPIPAVEEIIEAVSNVGGSTLQSLGLGGYWPIGLVQHALEWLHLSAGMPWWATIILGTTIARTIVFPVFVKAQRSAAELSRVMPEMQYIQNKMTEARKNGDEFEAHRCTMELMKFMKDNKVNPLKNVMVPLVQAPIFITFFLALRRMVQAPVESMKDGGLWWFTDLTIPDPYFILPIVTSATLFVTIKIGADAVRLETLGNAKYLLLSLPFILIPFSINFQGAILCYWVSTNLITLIQAFAFKQKPVKKFFNIPDIIKHAPQPTIFTGKKNFVEGFQDSWTNMKIAREMDARHFSDEMLFKNAAKGPLPKTFDYDPTLSPLKDKITEEILSKNRK